MTPYAIADQVSDLSADIARLGDASEVPDTLVVSALIYDVETGTAQELAAPRPLRELRQQ